MEDLDRCADQCERADFAKFLPPPHSPSPIWMPAANCRRAGSCRLSYFPGTVGAVGFKRKDCRVDTIFVQTI